MRFSANARGPSFASSVAKIGQPISSSFASASVIELLSGLLYVVRAAGEREDMPTARAGIAYGRAVSRAGDYFGHTVNLAARVLDQASASEVLVSEECVVQAQSGPFGFHEPRDANLKGIREPVRLWRAESALTRPVQPVGAG